MNPFEQKPMRLEDAFESLRELYPRPYDPKAVDPYTKCRVILMNGTEFEAEKFSHQFDRHTADQSLRRELTMSRRLTQMRQKRLANLKPVSESILEHTIGYEQLAVDLTAHLARRLSTPHEKAALDLALLEDFDHLYRYSDLLEADTGEHAEALVGRYTEIMPGRPTISEHRFPADGIPRPVPGNAPLFDKLAAFILTAAEQQTMNYYMNVTNFYGNDLGRRLYLEIAMIEEQHVTQYESLLDPSLTWLENLLMHEYVGCYLYWSCAETETDATIKRIWQRHLEQQLAQLHKAAELLERFERKHWRQVIPEAEFPAPLRLEPNVGYVRGALCSVQLTCKDQAPVPVQELDGGDPFFLYQRAVHQPIDSDAAHEAILRDIARFGRDYRFETAPHPVRELRSRKEDDTRMGRDPHIPGYTQVSAR